METEEKEERNEGGNETDLCVRMNKTSNQNSDSEDEELLRLAQDGTYFIWNRRNVGSNFYGFVTSSSVSHLVKSRPGQKSVGGSVDLIPIVGKELQQSVCERKTQRYKQMEITWERKKRSEHRA
ncbi:hypothetical protein NPIL_493101 [Nephila pilipes]|uniref:Uncharacterized protein n=1 Tax=Nephila pilipes TaxID=299642 RepID=A0A8X6ML95_NEPPI|nr:hypothetical protein NPIL_493101 [Nephila pilipes]